MKDGTVSTFGYYNFFNIRATGNTDSEVVLNALRHARSQGWNTPEASIAGGINFVAANYVAVGQNTAYFQKFNVVNRNQLFRNQYMQNIMAAQSEGSRMRSMYNNAGMVSSNLTFVIPIFENMPAQPAIRPSGTNPFRTRSFDRATLNVNGTLALRTAPNGLLLRHISNGANITVLERATTRVNGMYWDRVVAYVGASGHTGYMARGPATGTNLWINTHTRGADTIYAAAPGSGNNSGGATNPGGTNNAVRRDGNYIIVEPRATLDNIRAAGFTINTATLNGVNVVGTANVATGTVLGTNHGNLTVVKRGDLNGDGNVTVVDMILMQRHLTGVARLKGAEYRAARLSPAGETVSVVDMILMQRHLTGTSLITI